MTRYLLPLALSITLALPAVAGPRSKPCDDSLMLGALAYTAAVDDPRRPDWDALKQSIDITTAPGKQRDMATRYTTWVALQYQAAKFPGKIPPLAWQMTMEQWADRNCRPDGGFLK